jgi:hypothetical protein
MFIYLSIYRFICTDHSFLREDRVALVPGQNPAKARMSAPDLPRFSWFVNGPLDDFKTLFLVKWAVEREHIRTLSLRATIRGGRGAIPSEYPDDHPAEGEEYQRK